MIADYLHSFYTMPVNLVIGGVPTVAHIRWFKAPAGAKFLPFPSAIFSHVWDNNPGESQPGEIGEVGFPRTWDPGRNPGYQGQCFRGQQSWFQTGQLPALPLPSSPCLCQILPAEASGGVVLTGSASVPCQPYFAGPSHVPVFTYNRGTVSVGPANMTWNSVMQRWEYHFSNFTLTYVAYWRGGFAGQAGCGQVSVGFGSAFPGVGWWPSSPGTWLSPPNQSQNPGGVITVAQS